MSARRTLDWARLRQWQRCRLTGEAALPRSATGPRRVTQRGIVPLIAPELVALGEIFAVRPRS